MKTRRSFCCAAIFVLAIIFVSAPVLRANKKTAAATGESEYSNCVGAAARSRKPRIKSRAIKRIGTKRMEKMRKYLTVGKTVAPKKPADRGQPLAPPSTSKSASHVPAKTVNQNTPTPDVKKEPIEEKEAT
jgi:hypothetical protein